MRSDGRSRGQGVPESQQERFKDATLLALKMQEEPKSQGMQAASENWKRQENTSSPRAFRRNADW